MVAMNTAHVLFPLKALRPKVTESRIIGDGKVVEITFEISERINSAELEGTVSLGFQFHSAWLHDSSPKHLKPDYARKSANTLASESISSIVTEVTSTYGGVRISFTTPKNVSGEDRSMSTFVETYPLGWLFAWAPHVGKMVQCSSPEVLKKLQPFLTQPGLRAPFYNSDITLTDVLKDTMQKPWSIQRKGDPRNSMNHELLAEIPEFDAMEVFNSEKLQRDLLTAIVGQPGVAVIQNLPEPDDFARSEVGKNLIHWLHMVVFRSNQHGIRKTNWWIIESAEAESSEMSSDYDMNSPLNMHTDHSMYEGTPGFFQVMYQAIGDVVTKIADGLACVEYMKHKYPEYYKLLTTVPVSHGARHRIYNKDGTTNKTLAMDPSIIATREWENTYEIELIDTKPIIQIEKKKMRKTGACGEQIEVEEDRFVKISHQAMKRGVFGVDFETFDKFNEAYLKWCQVVGGCEPGMEGVCNKNVVWPQGSALITNNYRVLHGRASVLRGGWQDRPTLNPTVMPNVDNQNGNVSGRNGLKTTIPKNIPTSRRMVVGCYTTLQGVEKRLRLLLLKSMEKEHGKDFEMDENNCAVGNNRIEGRDVLARWFPRCPNKILERILVEA